MKQKKFKIKSNTVVKFKNNQFSTVKWSPDTEPTTTTFTTTSNTTGMFNK